MLRDRLSHLPCSQPVRTFPLKLDTGATTTCFDFFSASRAKHRLPWKTETVAEVAHIHHALLGETLSDFRRQQTEDPAAIGDRSLASLFRRHFTTEPDFHRPRVRVR